MLTLSEYGIFPSTRIQQEADSREIGIVISDEKAQHDIEFQRISQTGH
jgi:hypothetical protein